MPKKLNTLASFVFIALCVSIFSNISVTKAAFGVSPPWVRNDHLLPGSSFEEIIYLSRNETDGAMQVVTKFTGDKDLLKWIAIRNKDNLIFQPGQTVVPMTVAVEIPQTAELRDYKGGIFVTLEPLGGSAGGGQVAIMLGAHISVELSVIDQAVTDYKVKGMSVERLEENEPFSVNVKVANTGNTDVSDIEGEIDIYDSTRTEVIKSMPFNPLSEPVAADKTEEVKMVFENYILENGEYWVNVKATKDGEAVYEDRFPQRVGPEPPIVISPEDVLEPDVTSQEPAVVEKKGLNLMAGLAGMGLALLVVIGILLVPIVRNKLRKNRSTKKRRS